MASEKLPKDATTRVIIVGAGIGGISAAIALRRKLGHDNFVIYESGEEVGGTWRANSYPGCASDVSTHWYSLSTELNPNWKVTHVGQAELKQYWMDLARKHNLYENISFNTKVISAEWDEVSHVYQVEVELTNGSRQTDYARILIAGTGILSTPNHPAELSGIKRFKGEWFHSANWNHHVDLRNKRVAVIGNGCSAAQFVPVITEEPTTHVTQFWRSAMWYFPKMHGAFPPWVRWTFAHIPFVMRLYRIYLWARQEILYLLFVSGGRSSKARELLMKFLVWYMKTNAPKKYHEVLRPPYPFGCRRLIFDVGYYECLHRPNIELSNDRIVEINETGILTVKGATIPFDVIILATGFLPNDIPFHVRGSSDRTIKQYYKEKEGPTAYYGTMTAGFPNFFIIAGPNTLTGHGSAIFMEEVQINYILQVIEPVLNGLAVSFEPTDVASDTWNEYLQAKLSKSVWSTCVSYYRADEGKGKVTSIFPGTFAEFWWRLRKPIWKDFKSVGAEKWERERRSLDEILLKMFVSVGVLAAGYFATRDWDILKQVA